MPSRTHFFCRQFIPEDLVLLVEDIAADIDQYFEAPYAGEMRGIAKVLNCSVGEIVLAN